MRLLRLLFLSAAAMGAACAQDVRTATLVGAVTDASGAVVPNAAITITNTQTQVVSRLLTDSEGSYRASFLAIGSYELRVEAAGFKRHDRTGITLNAGETPRLDVVLEVGAVTDEVRVTAAAPLLATETAVVGSLQDAKTIHDTPMLQSKPQHVMYYMEGAEAMNNGTYHILGQPEQQLGVSIDGASTKQSIRSVLGETNTMITPPVDSIAEAQVWTTGIPAEVGHAAGGSYALVTKSGTNEVHFSAEERYIAKDFLHSAYFQQVKQNSPFEYHNFDATIGGPVRLPKIYDGRNKTFFFLAYRLDYDHEANPVVVSAPDQGMLNGNFSFGGLGYPIYDPKTIACTNPNGCGSSGAGWTATPFPGNQIPVNRFDPVTAKFLSLKPYQVGNTAGFYSATGPNNNYSDITHYLSDRQGYVGKIDQQISSTHKFFVRYAWNKFRVVVGRNAVQYAWTLIDSTTFSYGLPEPIDERNIVANDIYNFGPTLINEFRVAYQRRNDNVNPVLSGQGWAGILGIPGVGPQTFPGFINAGGSSVSWTANPGAHSRTLNDDFQFADNLTKVHGRHTLKWGYQGIRTRENDVTASQPSGTYSFGTGGTALPFTPNTGNSFASFLLGAVTSANFTTLLANYLPRWWSHQLYVQDDWRAARNLTVSVGVRYSYESPAQTNYSFKSQFDPAAADPLTGLMGAITHPKGAVYRSDRNNFTPRAGLSWNFKPHWVFRGSFGMFTQDVLPQLGQEEYVAQAAVQQPTGNPLPAFYLSQGPGSIVYNTNGSGTANFLGTNYSSRNATYLDPNLRNPYTMTWSTGFQWEFHPNTLAEAVYQGSAGVGLTSAVNINVLPQSIYSSTNTTLLNSVFAASQNYVPYPQFGSINETSNYGHSTYHALVTRVERRFSSGLSYNFLFTWSKNMGGAAGSGWQYYDWALTKGPTTNDVKYQFVSQASWELPFGQGRRFLNRGGVLNMVFGGWTALTIQSLRTGLPVTFSMSGSPYKYLSGQTQPSIVPGQAINVPNYAVGPNLWPQSSQNPFFNIGAFSYPAAFTGGSAGAGIGRAGGVWWPQYSLTKTWAYQEKYKLTARVDLNNLLPQTRAFLAPNSTVNITSPQTFGRFAPATGTSFSNWYTPNGTIIGVLRIQF